MKSILQDLRYGFRQIAKNLVYSCVAIFTLAIGIGATTTIFSVLKALVFDPFPYPKSDRIVFVWSNDYQPLSIPDFLDIQEETVSFSSIGIYSPEQFNLSGDQPESIRGASCTEGVLRSLGIQPMMGRWLDKSDEQTGAARVVILSYELWIRNLNADPDAIGKSIQVNGISREIVGIMPKQFEFFSPWNQTEECQLWLPLDVSQNTNRGNHWLLCVGRMKEGISLSSADAEVKTIGAQLTKAYPDTNLRKPFLVRSLWNEGTKHNSSKLWILMGSVLLVLLVACTNVASMLLAWGTRRQAEFSVRIALGATRRQILRLLLSEYVLLGFFGCALGILFSLWGVTAMQSLVPATMARRSAMQIDLPVLLFSGGLSLLTVFLFGIPPAFTAACASLQECMKQSGKSHTGSRLRHRFLQGLVAVQIAMALVLSNGASLLSASYLNVLKSNPKMNTEYILSSLIGLNGSRYEQGTYRTSFVDQLLLRVRSIPGVKSAAITDRLPLEGGNNCEVLVDDEVYDPQIKRPLTELARVSPDFFAALDLSFLQGRSLTPEDALGDSTGVVVNRTLAEKFWPGENPLGRKIRSNGMESWFSAQVVGVVEEIRQWGAELPAVPQIYFPYEKRPSFDVYLIVHAQTDAHAFTPFLRQELASLDRNLPLSYVRTMKEILNNQLHGRRFLTQLIDFFMTATLVLAAVGIYGTLSYQVAQQTRELGLRIALGATPQSIVAFVFRRAGTWVVLGLLAGLGLIVILSYFLDSIVYNVSPLHPQSLLLGLGLVGGAACLACLLPARRAILVDPITALRCE